MYWAGTWPQCADKRSDVAWIIFQLHPLPPTPAHVMRGRGASPHIARFGLVLLHNPYLTSSQSQMIARLQKTDQWQCTSKWVFVSKLKGQVRSFYWLKIFIGPKIKEVSTGNFHQKDQKLVKKSKGGSYGVLNTIDDSQFWVLKKNIGPSSLEFDGGERKTTEPKSSEGIFIPS